MTLQEQPAWRQLYAPSSYDELLALRDVLAHHPQFAQKVEAFLYAESVVMYRNARVELNPELRQEYQHSANTLVEILGKLFQPLNSPDNGKAKRL